MIVERVQLILSELKQLESQVTPRKAMTMAEIQDSETERSSESRTTTPRGPPSIPGKCVNT